MYCKKCGALLPDDAAFCGKCGAETAPVAEEPAVADVPAAAEPAGAAAPAGAYPPGVPVILPGQKITEDMVDYLILLRNRGYGLFGVYQNNIEIACV